MKIQDTADNQDNVTAIALNKMKNKKITITTIIFFLLVLTSSIWFVLAQDQDLCNNPSSSNKFLQEKLNRKTIPLNFNFNNCNNVFYEGSQNKLYTYDSNGQEISLDLEGITKKVTDIWYDSSKSMWMMKLGGNEMIGTKSTSFSDNYIVFNKESFMVDDKGSSVTFYPGSKLKLDYEYSPYSFLAEEDKEKNKEQIQDIDGTWGCHSHVVWKGQNKDQKIYALACKYCPSCDGECIMKGSQIISCISYEEAWTKRLIE